MTKRKPKLSSNPGRLILQALEDLETIEKTPGYVIDMGGWHDYWANEPACHVCFAGAVMANRLGVRKRSNVSWRTVEGMIYSDSLIALDFMRSGYWETAIKENLGLPFEYERLRALPCFTGPERMYHPKHRRSFKKKMRQAARLLLKVYPE